MVKLKFVAFHITYVCENKCPYCYVGDEKRQGHPSLERVERVVEKLASEGIEEVLLVGGDPCAFPHLRELVELIKKLNLKISILSSTLKFEEDIDFFLKNIDSFQATILGENAEAHDKEAGRKGAFGVLTSNINLLNQKRRKVAIALSLHGKNHNKVFRMVENLVEGEGLKVDELIVQRVIPLGRGLHRQDFSISREQVPVIFKQLHEIKKSFNLKICFEDPFPLCLVPKEFSYLQGNACEWGFSKAAVNFEGGLSRCGADLRFILGNIFKINDIQNFWRDNGVLVDFRGRGWLPIKCQNCELLEKCGGGCPLSKITSKDHECDILCPFP